MMDIPGTPQDHYQIMQKTRLISIPLIVGVLFLGAALFLNELGLDPNPIWSKRRIVLLIFGLILLFSPWFLRSRSSSADKATKDDLFALPLLLAILGIYLWFAGIGSAQTSHYYSTLATSFRRGELFLPLNPDPALLQLANPYDPAERQGIKVPQDVSLYKGKFYLYWGPGPAMLLAIAQPVLPGKISEVHLLFLFMCGIFLAQYVFIMKMWERFFPALPQWILFVSIILAGSANPALWLLTQPKIYETAVAGAQFFFISGFVSVILALFFPPGSRWKLALAGAFWSLAVLTRVVMVFPILFMTCLVISWYFRIHRKSLVRLAAELVPLGIPLVIGAATFAWYNWARFGSIMETGFTYQLAAPYLQKHLNELFSPAYLLQNLYNYALNPFGVKESFPFLYSARGVIEPIFARPSLPGLYTSQAITGFLISSPFLVFAAIPAIIGGKKFLAKNRTSLASEETTPDSFNWILISLFGSFLLPFISLLAFFWAAMRYAEDFMPALILLSLIGFWQGYTLLSQKTREGKIYAFVGTLLAGISAINSVLLAISIYVSRGSL